MEVTMKQTFRFLNASGREFASVDDFTKVAAMIRVLEPWRVVFGKHHIFNANDAAPAAEDEDGVVFALLLGLEEAEDELTHEVNGLAAQLVDLRSQRHIVRCLHDFETGRVPGAIGGEWDDDSCE